MKKYNLAPGDFPDIAEFQSKLQEHEFNKFSTLKQKLIDDVENVLGTDFPRLMEALPRSLDTYSSDPDGLPTLSSDIATFDAPVRGQGQRGTTGQSISYLPPLPPPAPTFTAPKYEDSNPWGDDSTQATSNGPVWELQDFVAQYSPQFNSIQKNGLVTGNAAKGILSASGLPNTVLRKIWELGDIDKDGSLDLQEFIIVMFLTDKVKEGHEVPAQLDEAMYPPGKGPR